MIQPRKTVQTLQAYSPPLEGRRGFMRLDFNENTTGFSEAYGENAPSLMTAYPEYQTLLEKLSSEWNIGQERLLLTNGSDEGLFTLAFTFIEPNVDKAVISSPTYALIPHYLKLVQSQLIEIPVNDDYLYDIEGIEAALKNGVKLAMFASPDNPTGAVIHNETIRRWCQKYPNTLFIIDEAYAEYAPESALPLVEEFGNLAVTRTFSKAWGMAGLRLGVVIAQPQLIEAMQRVRSPYSVNTLAVSTASELLDCKQEVLQQASDTMQRKKWVISEVEAYGYRIVPGNANFFMMHVGIHAKAFCEFFRQKGILVRDRSSMPKLDGKVRVSIGSQQEMKQFLSTLAQYHARQTLLFDMDDTLVDTSESFDAVIKTLVEKYSGQPLVKQELQALRAEGGFNDDWDATVELLNRRNVQKPRTEIADEGVELYLKVAPQKETWIISPEQIQKLKQRYRLGVVTGRCRIEYESVWQDRFTPLFELVVCQDDYPDAGKKPKPDLLLKALNRLGLEQGFYIGNSVDDMQAARAAGLGAVGVTTTQSAEVLNNAGADWILNDFNELARLFG